MHPMHIQFPFQTNEEEIRRHSSMEAARSGVCVHTNCTIMESLSCHPLFGYTWTKGKKVITYFKAMDHNHEETCRCEKR
jgi:hypothetical protein